MGSGAAAGDSSVDPQLARFAADLRWLADRGIEVERYSLSERPQVFATNPVVTAALDAEGNRCLPLILVNGQIAGKRAYPNREELARLCGVVAEPEPAPAASLYTEAVAELVAIGAAIAANCEPCFNYHFQQATKLGISREDMMRAVKTAQRVKETPAKAMLELARRLLEAEAGGRQQS